MILDELTGWDDHLSIYFESQAGEDCLADLDFFKLSGNVSYDCTLLEHQFNCDPFIEKLEELGFKLISTFRNPGSGNIIKVYYRPCLITS